MGDWVPSRWTQQSRQPSADLAEKPPRGVDAVTARKIYRHHQRQTVEALDRLLNEVIDKSLFDLALEVLKKVRPDAAQWDSLSARMATGPQADELRAVFSSEGEGGTPKVVEMSGGDEDAEEDEAKKAEAKLAETASTKASAPSLGSAIPKKASPAAPTAQVVPPMQKAVPTGPAAGAGGPVQVQAPLPGPPAMHVMGTPMMGQMPMMGFQPSWGLPMMSGVALAAAAKAEEEAKAKAQKEEEEEKKRREAEAKAEWEKARARSEAEARAREKREKEEAKGAAPELPPAEFEEIVNSMPVTPFWKIPPQKADIPLGIRLRVFDGGGAREVASMAVTKPLIFGMDAERSHVVERRGQGVYAEHVALVYTAKGFHLNPISGQSVQSAVTHHPKLLVKLRTECEEKLSGERRSHVMGLLDQMEKQEIRSVLFQPGDGRKKLTWQSCVFSLGRSERIYFLDLVSKADELAQEAGGLKASEKDGGSRSKPEEAPADNEAEKATSPKEEMAAAAEAPKAAEEPAESRAKASNEQDESKETPGPPAKASEPKEAKETKAKEAKEAKEDKKQKKSTSRRRRAGRSRSRSKEKRDRDRDRDRERRASRRGRCAPRAKHRGELKKAKSASQDSANARVV
ncbi:unnamed protein product [Symbiodinium necroappetens]|uniref:Uncharacterized protein n=1 Tax=Symbiodinium necroappetens TaxID=1628268 RepID=A0A812M4E9_9DINO|nr:unnamed protein product [Symbiodinium necroappetens]